MKLTFDVRTIPSEQTAKLAEQEAEAWLAELETSDADTSILSEDEIARASDMAPGPSRRMIKTRCLLRRVLSWYLGTGPGDIEFDYGPKGKPRLAGEHASSGFHFSVSHTRDRAIIGIGRSPLGIDIESRRTIRDIGALAARFFAPGEARALHCVPAPQRELAFLRYWTRKEAYAKATGDGIAMGLRNFEVASIPSRGLVLLGRDGNPDHGWTIRELHPEPGLVGALAMSQPDCSLWCWKVKPSVMRSGSL